MLYFIGIDVLIKICNKKDVEKQTKMLLNLQNALHTWQNIQHARIPREIGWILVYVVKALEQS